MNSINALERYVKAEYPAARVELAPPVHSDGLWSLEVDLSEKHFTVEWSVSAGFGFSSASDQNFGEGVDETLRTLDDAKRRVDQLLTTDEQTAPPLPVLLSRLRERFGLTQQELASKLGIRQATVSGIERRQDIQLSTLQRVVEALGGKLEIIGVFSGVRYRVDSGLSARPSEEVTPPLACADGVRQGDCEPSETSARKEPKGGGVRFASLEQHHQLEPSERIAQLVRKHGFFAECA
jgi:transcriptional regulator with XRE-family HTH domain